MFITQQEVNRVLDAHFTNNGQFDQQHFDNSLQIVLDNHHDLYDLMRTTAVQPVTIAFEALRRFAQEACEGEYGEVQGLTTSLLVHWLWNHDETDTYSLAPMDNTIAYITNERAEAQKEKEETTMKNTITENTVNTASNIATEDITCSECGAIIVLAGQAIDNSDFEIIDGEYVCRDCVEREFVECADCGEWVRRDDAHAYEGEYICDDCFSENYVICDRCGDVIHIDDATYTQNEEYICESCRDRFYTRCDRCGDWVRDWNIYNVNMDTEGYDTESWCGDCTDNYAWTCRECDELYSDDVSDNGCCVCDNCYGGGCDTGDINTWRSPSKRMPYGYKPVPCMCATDEEINQVGFGWEKKIVFYGFELEIDRRDKDVDIDDTSADIVTHLPSTYCKTDCSLDMGGSYSGIEIVSHPATLAWYMDHRSDFEECFEMLRGDGWLSHDAGTCGLHVHISLEAMEAQNPYAVNNMLFIFDRFWKQLVRFSRRTESQLNHWAKRYSTARGEYKQIKHMAKSECGRYMAVNLQNAHTVELRMWRGTLNPDSFFATLQLVDTIVKRCIEIGDDYRMLQAITWKELVQSDHEILNAYLEKRGLSGEEMSEPVREVREGNGSMTAHDFNVGDRVRAIAAPDGNARFIGRYGRIRRIDTGDRLNVLVDFDGGDSWWSEAETLEIVGESEEAPAENAIRVGTRVQINDNYTIAGVRGMTGTVVHIDSDGDFAVEMDEESNYFHDCGGRTREHHGYWLLRDDVAVVNVLNADEALLF